MRKSIDQIAWVAVLPLLFFGPVLGQGQNELSVKCLDADGRALQRTSVFILGLRGAELLDETTNRQGVATFRRLPDDVYRIWARKEGYAPALFEFLHLEDDRKENLELNLVAGDVQTLFYFEDPELSSRADQLFMEGAQAIRQGRIEAAEEKLSASLEINPSNPDTRTNLALVYLESDRLDEARDHLEKAADLMTTFIAAQTHAGNVLEDRLQEINRLLDNLPMISLQRQADKAIEASDSDAAIALHEEMLELQPDDPDIYYNLALLQAQADRLEESRQTIERGLRVDSNSENLLSLSKSVDELERNRELNLARSKVANVEELFQNEDSDAVIAEAKRIRQEVPKEFHAQLALLVARSHIRLGQTDEAIRAFEEVFDRAPQQPEFRRELANFLIQESRFSEAIATLEKAFEAEGEPVHERLFELGRQSVARGNQELAGLLFERVVEIRPEFAEGHYQLGMDYFYNRKQPVRARELLNRYLEIGENPDHLRNARSVLTVIERGAQ